MADAAPEVARVDPMVARAQSTMSASRSHLRKCKTQIDTITHEDKPPMRYIELVGDHPLKMFGLWSFCCVFFVGMCIVSSSMLYTSMTNFPFYVKGHIAYERQEAVHQARLDADAVLPITGVDTLTTKTAKYLPRSKNLYTLQIIYEGPENENIWDLKHVQTIAEIENMILTGSGNNLQETNKTRSYSDYCQVVYDPSGKIANASNPCRIPFSGLSFLQDSWMPVPYAKTFPSALWVNEGSTALQQCTLPLISAGSPDYQPKSTDPFVRMIESWLPANFTYLELTALISTGQICEIGKRIMPHTVKADGTCPIFEQCYVLMYNTCSLVGFGWSQNQMWSLLPEDIQATHERNFQKFTDYWSTYGDPTSPLQPKVEHSLVEGPYSPFVYAKVDVSVDGTKRRFFAQELPNVIRRVADSTFGFPKRGKTGRAVMSTFYFGGPLTNIDPSWTSLKGDQTGSSDGSGAKWTQDFGAWLFDTYHTKLMDMNDKAPGGLKLTWKSKDLEEEGGDPLSDAYVTGSVLPTDLKLLMAAFAFVFCFILALKRSLFLAGLAMTMILMTAIPTLAIYVLVLQQTFLGILQLLSMFIIMGIGADDIFVLLDCYEADRDFRRGPERRELKYDLSAAWRHAAKATFVTSLTTFFSFLSNASSPFPAIATFGLWCCALIVVNYVSVHTFYLAVISIYDKYFCQKRIFCLGNRTDLGGAEPAGSKVVDVSAAGDEMENEAETEEFFGAALFFADKAFPLINKARYPLIVIWVILTGIYFGFAMTLEPDPDAPNILPDDDPYGQWRNKLVKHYSAIDNPFRIKTELVFGINAEKPLDREGTDPVKATDRGKVMWSTMIAPDAEWEKFQTWLTDMCEDLLDKSNRKEGTSMEGLDIASQEDIIGKDIIECPFYHFKSWAKANGVAFPVPTVAKLQSTLMTYFAAKQVEDPSQLNWEKWQGKIYFQDNPNDPAGVEFKFMTVGVNLKAQYNQKFEDGLVLSDKWNTYIDQKKSTAPPFIQKGFYVTDSHSFHWFVSQETINKECYKGIALSLFLAYIVLLIATANWVVATAAVASITSIVFSVICFSVWNGWKLGMLEAIIFVMVIGMSVDYVVHMADAYLESREEDRKSRARFMMGKMAMSVLSGAITTLGSSFFMVFAHITFFKKFGLIILYTIFQSLVTSLLFFTALMAGLGPEGTFGDIPFGLCFAKLKERFGSKGGGDKAEQEDQQIKVNVAEAPAS